MHHPAGIEVVAPDAMHHARIVPDQHVADSPFMRVDEARLGGPIHQALDECSTFFKSQPFNMRGVRSEHERLAAEAMSPCAIPRPERRSALRTPTAVTIRACAPL